MMAARRALFEDIQQRREKATLEYEQLRAGIINNPSEEDTRILIQDIKDLLAEPGEKRNLLFLSLTESGLDSHSLYQGQIRKLEEDSTTLSESRLESEKNR